MIDHGDLDTAFQIFSCGMVWDGNLVSKCSRSRLMNDGYAVRHAGMQALTGKGAFALLLSPRAWLYAWRTWRETKRNPFIADAEEINRAMG